MNNSCSAIKVLGLPGWLSSGGSACNAGDAGNSSSIHGSGRSPGEVNGTPLQYSCLKNHGQRSLVACSPLGRRVRHNCSN